MTDGFTDEDILNYFREHEHPCLTASEVAEYFGKSNGAALHRLSQLEKEERLKAKKVGAAAKVWYLLG